MTPSHRSNLFFFFNDTATTEIYTLSLHDALPISRPARAVSSFTAVGIAHSPAHWRRVPRDAPRAKSIRKYATRSEEHTSELQSRQYLVCRLLLEKKKKPISLMSLSAGKDIYTVWK